MKKALTSIDYTCDFVVGDGKLTAGKPAQATGEATTRVTKGACEAGNHIFFATDGHDEGDGSHPETKLLPPHNIRRISGRDLYGQLAGLYAEIKEDSKISWLDKCHYSALSGTDLGIRLRERRVTTVVLTGVLTGTCVPHAAIDAYNLGCDIKIPAGTVASLTEENRQFALNHLKNVLGAEIV